MMVGRFSPKSSSTRVDAFGIRGGDPFVHAVKMAGGPLEHVAQGEKRNRLVGVIGKLGLDPVQRPMTAMMVLWVIMAPLGTPVVPEV
jgi:hypothetical protein